MNLLAIGVADRSMYKEGATNSVSQWSERRLALFDNYAYSKGNMSLAYLGYADVSLNNNNNIIIQDIHLRDDLATQYFTDLGGGVAYTEASDDIYVTVHNDKGEEVKVPRSIFVNEQLAYATAGFGWQDKETGKRFRTLLYLLSLLQEKTRYEMS